jgi:hypothetical protein
VFLPMLIVVLAGLAGLTPAVIAWRRRERAVAEMPETARIP